MNNQRTIDRHHSYYHSPVVDIESGNVVGFTVDMSDTGLCLISESGKKVGTVYHLRLDLPKPVNCKEFIEFKAIVRWCRKDTNPDYKAIGLELVEPPEDILTIMQALQQTLCFVD